MRLSLSAMLALALAAAFPAHAEDIASAGDPARGAAIYERCGGCHSLERDRTGPRHCGLIGRKAGSVPGFGYSRAMKKSGIVWTPEALDKFLANPRKAVPGTIMTYAGVKDARERADLIAYLAKADADPALCPRD
ncbi:MAG: c-type cytochrome [Candidatus Eiseniibacteriota bacterium]